MPKLMSRPKCVLRVDGTPVECLEQPVSVWGNGGKRAGLPKAPGRTPADFAALERNQLAFKRRGKRHGMAWLPPRFATDMLPDIRALKNFWRVRGLDFD